MLFLVEVNTTYSTNLNELCMKNTTPHVGKLGQNFSSQDAAVNGHHPPVEYPGGTAAPQISTLLKLCTRAATGLPPSQGAPLC